MTELHALHKTNRVNMLFDFYEPLLTEKQRTFMKAYFHDDYSLGEIASEFQISRQAVFEHIKRAEQSLEEYEQKLQLLDKHERRTACLHDIAELLDRIDAQTKTEVERLVRKMME